MTAPVSFHSRAGDCFEMMSARLSQPVISTASAVRAAEAATWAEAVCMHVLTRVCVCLCVYMCACAHGDGNKPVGLNEDRAAVCKNPHWEQLHIQGRAGQRHKKDVSQTTTTSTQKLTFSFSVSATTCRDWLICK